MDVLTEMMVKAQEAQVLTKIPGYTLMQRLSLYADDVVLFIRPMDLDLLFVRDALSISGEASGLVVNYTKSSATMIRATEEETKLVRAALPWKMETFPLKYVGLQLGMKQLKRSEWQPILDDVIRLMPGWQRGLVTRHGRLIMVNNMVRARPTHHLIIAEAPKWALEKIDKSCRSFFWVGTEDMHGGK
ncbi:Serine/threonine-phosphatase BSL2-like protein [Hordeum vulgare]|nr:Serine/threonine-phosphatase BSL2-like protein [Hordeum vulgare]